MTSPRSHSRLVAGTKLEPVSNQPTFPRGACSSLSGATSYWETDHKADFVPSVPRAMPGVWKALSE